MDIPEFDESCHETVHQIAPLTIGVVGLGPFGRSIIELGQGYGHKFIGVDSDGELLSNVARLYGEGAPASRLSFSQHVSSLADADIVFDATNDTFHDKQALMVALNSHCQPEAILVITSRRFGVAHVALISGRPANVLGLRSFLPLNRDLAVEIVPGVFSDADCVDKVRNFLESISLRTLEFGAHAYFVAERLMYAHMNRCAKLVDTGQISSQDLDRIMRLAFGVREGPLELVERIGVASAAERLAQLRMETCDDRFSPAQFFRRAGHVGTADENPGESRGPATRFNTLSSSSNKCKRTARVGILGSGRIARHLAQVVSNSGVEVALVSRSASRSAAAVRQIESDLDKDVYRGLISPAQRTTAASNLFAEHHVSAIRNCEIIIEAVSENAEVKREVLDGVDAICGEDALLLTTTMTLRHVDICRDGSLAKRLVGLHVVNLMLGGPMVELVADGYTDPACVNRAAQFCEEIGKAYFVVDDSPGFLVNRLVFAYFADALDWMSDPLTDPDESSRAAAVGFGHALGPIEWMNWLGWNHCSAIFEDLLQGGIIGPGGVASVLDPCAQILGLQETRPRHEAPVILTPRRVSGPASGLRRRRLR